MRSSQLDDKRKVIVSLTKDGHEQAEQLYQDVYQQHEKLISYIGVEDAKVMLAILEKIFSYIKAH